MPPFERDDQNSNQAFDRGEQHPRAPVNDVLKRCTHDLHGFIGIADDERRQAHQERIRDEQQSKRGTFGPPLAQPLIVCRNG